MRDAQLELEAHLDEQLSPELMCGGGAGAARQTRLMPLRTLLKKQELREVLTELHPN